jgi:hypothetical protein
VQKFFSFLLLSGLAAAQEPRIGVVDYYGLHKVTPAQVQRALGAKEGDRLPPSKGDAEERMDRISGVVESHLEAICCEQGKITLYAGIEERGAPHFDLREAPGGDETLPPDVTSSYARFLDAFQGAARAGTTDEDLRTGHARSADPETRAIQDSFPVLADDNLEALRKVLRNADDEQQRATAAYIIAYASNQSGIVNDLQYALTDADSGVRANAVRGLLALAIKAKLDPSSGIKVEPTWFIEMLNSLSWTDRTRALGALQILTDSRDPAILQQLHDRALSALVDMARWKTLAHALPAYILLGRAEGMPEQEIKDSWSRGDRETLIARALKKK